MARESNVPGVVLSSEVGDAIAARKPVVALESTIICHGMPHPQNVETARRVQDAVREEGAIPATEAVLDGRSRVGLSSAELEYLGERGEAVTKVSRRDLPFVIARKQDGARTVAATMFLASLAGIPVFATGGIGGVHRWCRADDGRFGGLDRARKNERDCRLLGREIGAGHPEDRRVSRDGVPVIGFRTDTLPAFYARSSGIPVDYRADELGDIARAMQAKWTLPLDGGIVVGVPVPESHAIDPDDIDLVIDEAIREMQYLDISGKDTTPFLLRRIAEETQGKSLEANIELVVNNARVAARIGAAYTALTRPN